MPDDSNPFEDSSKLTYLASPIHPEQLQPVWANLLTAYQSALTAVSLAPKFDLSSVITVPSFEVSKFLVELDLSRTTEPIQQLAMRGWSLPWHLSFGETEDLVNGNPADIDTFFEVYFDGGGLDGLRQDILGEKKLEKWKLLLDQCFRNYQSGDFQICIPSLIAVLEGSFDYLSFFKEGNRKEFFEEHIKAATGFQKLTWLSLYKFCGLVFMSGDPRKPTDYINRHKVMHGLDDPLGWKKVDCLRLFQALDSTRRLK